MSPIGAVARGLAAGAIGTAAMTAWQEFSTKLQSSGEDRAGRGTAAPGAADADPWERASAPAKVARRLLEDLSYHLAYGAGTGIGYAAADRRGASVGR